MKGVLNLKRSFTLLIAVLLILTPVSFSGFAQKETEHDVDLWNVVKPLSTTVTFLNTGAHPDDERSDFLAYLSRGLGVKTSSLIANRGEGGQNEIGTELGNPLGIIRSNEMIEAAEITGVKAYHLSETTSDSIYDFGFSKSPEETLEKWDEELTYERLIRFIRTYQPDIVMPSFRDVVSQHGHHRAMTILSERAYADAADPDVFPNQLEEGLEVWQTKKLYLPAASKESATLSIEIGDYDPVYEMTYPQLGEASRYLHKSQGMGRDIPAEPRQTHLELVNSTVPTEENDLFEGIPYDLNEWADIVAQPGLSNQLRKLQGSLDEIIDLYPNRTAIFPESQQALKETHQLIQKIKKAKLSQDVKNDLLHKLELKVDQLTQVSFVSSNLQVETDISSHVLTQGQEVKLTMTIANDGGHKINHVQAALDIPENWESNGPINLKHLKPGEAKTAEFHLKVPEDAAYYHPYDEPAIQPIVSYKEKGTETTTTVALDNTVAVLPELGVSIDPENVMVNTSDVQENIPLTVKVKNYAANNQDAKVSLKLPKGWSSEPEITELTFTERFVEKEVAFTVTPPADIEEGNFEIGAIVESNGKKFNTTVQEIQYDHINDEYFLYSSVANGIAFELLIPDNLNIGYIESGFDNTANHLMNAGFKITKLTEADIESSDLSQYDSIVTGIRANLSRPDLVKNNDRLLQYVEDGGHLVVQYHKPNDNWDPHTSAPYHLQIGSPSIQWRVTDEEAEVTMTQPNHKLFNYPNQITSNDWDNWVQERGLYFPMNWDNRYETFVEMADPDEEPFDGGILLAEYGEGTYLYSNLVFYRQIDGQVPGGYRIFTNLISYGVEE
ncbi:hypothetical protein E2C16_11030 [Sporosarcina pasteurii]|nr:hypothetical protein E2C16_11030 [Sporosarcina pasteurii]